MQASQEQYVAISQESFITKIEQFIKELKEEYERQKQEQKQMNPTVESIDKILIPFGLFIDNKIFTFNDLIKCIKTNLVDDFEDPNYIFVNQKLILILFYYIFYCDNTLELENKLFVQIKKHISSKETINIDNIDSIITVFQIFKYEDIITIMQFLME